MSFEGATGVRRPPPRNFIPGWALFSPKRIPFVGVDLDNALDEHGDLGSHGPAESSRN